MKACKAEAARELGQHIAANIMWDDLRSWSAEMRQPRNSSTTAQVNPFAIRPSRDLELMLLRVEGMGRKRLRDLRSAMDDDALYQVGKENDVNALTRLEGIGEKMAKRLIAAIRCNIEARRQEDPAGALLSDSEQDAISALSTLVEKDPARCLKLCADALVRLNATRAEKTSHRKAFASAARKALKKLERGPQA